MESSVVGGNEDQHTSAARLSGCNPPRMEGTVSRWRNNGLVLRTPVLYEDHDTSRQKQLVFPIRAIVTYSPCRPRHSSVTGGGKIALEIRVPAKEYRPPRGSLTSVVGTSTKPVWEELETSLRPSKL